MASISGEVVAVTRSPDYLDAARQYLSAELGERAPAELALAAVFDERPLDGEGRTAVLRFELPPLPLPRSAGPAAGDALHYVVVGETQPSYYPGYGLTPDDAYSLHIGTRFALVVGLQILPLEHEPPTARPALRSVIESCNPRVPYAEQPAALFQCGEQIFAVYRVSFRDRTVYCFGADCPPGFEARIDLPPQVSLRLHLGRVIRADARTAALAGGRDASTGESD